MSTGAHADDVILLAARHEEDGTYTLILDPGPNSETLPTVLGSGFHTIADCVQAIYATLTEPAVGQDVKDLVDDLAPKVQELLDVQAAHDETQGELAARLATVEEWMRAVQAGTLPRPAPPRATYQEREPETPAVPRGPSPTTLRRPMMAPANRRVVIDPRLITQQDLDTPEDLYTTPRKGHPIATPTPHAPAAVSPPDKNAHQYEGQAPEFERGTMIPHIPVGGVTRGPGSR